MNYILKTVIMHLDYYFTEGIEVLLSNINTYAIYLYDDENTLISKNDAKNFEKKLLEGVCMLYGTSQGYNFKIALTQEYDRGRLHVYLYPMLPIKAFDDDSGELDIAWYSTVLINLCQGFTIERMYAGTEELCSQEMKDLLGWLPLNHFN